MTRLVNVAVYYDLTEAMVARSFLEAYGFKVHVADEILIQTHWHALFAIQGIRLQIVDSDAIETRKLLLAVRQEDDNDQAPLSSETTPLLYKIMGIMFLFNFSAPFPFWKSSRNPILISILLFILLFYWGRFLIINTIVITFNTSYILWRLLFPS